MPSAAAGPKTYLVVGASGSIGSAVAQALAADDVTIGLHYCQNLGAVERIQASLTEAGARGVCLQSALESETACTRWWDEVSMALGPLDGLALCGGRVPWRAWPELAASDWHEALFEHCIAPFTLTRLAVAGMQACGTGSVVFLSSIAAKYGGSPRTIHYAAAKAALETAMRGLSREVAGAGVRINGVRSGFVDTPQQHTGRSPQQIAERIQKIPMGRAGRPQEVAAAMAFLTAQAASFVTGEVLTVAGGD